jgi:hypothetical protein
MNFYGMRYNLHEINADTVSPVVFNGPFLQFVLVSMLAETAGG